MSEERQYGLEDGYNDAESGKSPSCKSDAPDVSEYEIAYVEGYQRALAEREARHD